MDITKNRHNIFTIYIYRMVYEINKYIDFDLK